MAFIFVCLSSLFYGIEPTFQDLLLETGVTPIAMVGVCNGLAGLMLAVFMLIRKISFKLSPRQLIEALIVGGVGLFLTDSLLNTSYVYIPVGFVTMIHFMYPTIVCIVTTIMNKEGWNTRKTLQLVFSIGGMVLLTAGIQFTGSFIGVITAFLSAVAYSIYVVGLDKMSLRYAPVMTQNFYVIIFSAIPALALFARGTEKMPINPQSLWLAFVVALLFLSAVCTLNYGISILGSEKVAFLNTLEPLISMVFSTIVLSYAVTPWMVLGSICIMISLFVTIKGSTKKENASEVR